MSKNSTKEWVQELEEAMNQSFPIKKREDTEIIEQKVDEITGSDLSEHSFPHYRLGNAAAEAYESSNLSDSEYIVRASVIRAFDWNESTSMTSPTGDWNYFREGWEEYRQKN